MQHTPPNASYIRAPHSMGLRNHFASFRRTFTPGPTGPTVFHLFADSRYRLFVNGQFVAYGPARFATGAPQWDTHDLTPLLRGGENEIRVELNFYGTSSYQTMPDGAPGWIGWGGSADGSVDLSTPGSWACKTHAAWDADAPLFSFAQNPVEILDLGRLHEELNARWEEVPEVIPQAGQPWGPLQPRRTPRPSYAPHRPARVRLFAEACPALELAGFQSRDPGLARRILDHFEKNKARPDHHHRAFAFWIHSPKAQTIGLHGFWAELHHQGNKIPMRHETSRGNHGIFDLPLHEGWNFLAAHISLLEEVWAWLMGWEASSGITVRALPAMSAKHRFCLSPVSPTAPELPVPVNPGDFQIPEGWVLDEGDVSRITPTRQAAWDVVGKALPLPSSTDDLTLPSGSSRLVTYDFQDQFYGHVSLDVEAPAGTVLDVCFDDWLLADGRVALYASNHFTNATDRYVLPGGRVKIEGLNPRGGIYLQLAFRLPEGAASAAVNVHRVFVRSRRTLTDHMADFQSGNDVLDWAVATSHRTLQASTDETFADCPWRERGTYIGDGLVNFQLLAQMSADLSIAANFLRLFAESQLPDGQMPACTPSWLRRPHEDFTLIWVLALHDYWARSGEIGLVGELWPAVRRLWASSKWEADASGLWAANHHHVFIDWGCPRQERTGAANACLNIFRVAAARALSELAARLALPGESASFAREADEVAKMLVRELWIAEEGRFAPSRGGSGLALHANVLALRFGIGDPEAILHYLEPFLRENLRRGLEAPKGWTADGKGGHIELYFLSYLLPALAANGRASFALELLGEHYGYLKSLGFPTFNECFARARHRAGSCCHSWSGAPALFAYPIIGGVRQREAGNPIDWELHPPAECFTGDQLTLTTATRLGPLTVRWQRGPRGFTATWQAPEGLRVHVVTGCQRVD